MEDAVRLEKQAIAKHRHGHRQRGERPRITEHVKITLARAAALLVAGVTHSQASRTLGVKLRLLRDWERRHRTLFAELQSQAICINEVLAERRTDVRISPARPADRPPIVPSNLAVSDCPLSGTVGIGPTLPDFFRRFYEPRLIGRSVGTTMQYENTIRCLCKYAGRVVTLGDLSDELLAGFMLYCIKSGRNVAPTVNKHRRNILAIWRFAYRKKAADGQRFVKELPDVERIREIKRTPVAWSVEEYSRLLTTASKSIGMVGGIPAGKWWHALLLFLYYTGLRITPALMVRSEDFELTDAGGYVRVRGETQKQKADQQFKLPPDCSQAILAITKDRAGKDRDGSFLTGHMSEGHCSANSAH